jgi:MOSC domain-containing protein YiiM
MPCDKFVAFFVDPQAARKMLQSGFSGFYLSVVTPGSIAADQSFTVESGVREMPLMSLYTAVRAKIR